MQKTQCETLKLYILYPWLSMYWVPWSVPMNLSPITFWLRTYTSIGPFGWFPVGNAFAGRWKVLLGRWWGQPEFGAHGVPKDALKACLSRTGTLISCHHVIILGRDFPSNLGPGFKTILRKRQNRSPKIVCRVDTNCRTPMYSCTFPEGRQTTVHR